MGLSSLSIWNVVEVPSAEGEAAALFRRCFNSEAPTEPRHFVAMHNHHVVGYIHFSPVEGGIFLCGGLCVDARIYRRLERSEREAIAARGSLARWLSDESIAALGRKNAVFAYTGDSRSRRDAFALGFVDVGHRYILAQWHDAPAELRPAMIARVEAMGPF